MSVLVINEEVRAAIKAALERARAKPLALEMLNGIAMPSDTRVIRLADRDERLAQRESEHLMLGTYRASVSFEQQLSGLFRHLSVSSHRVGFVPGPEVMEMIAPLYGFRKFPPLPDEGTIWLEEFDPQHFAVNVVEIVANG